MRRILLLSAGSFCLFFTVIPLGYGLFNTGVAALLLASVSFFACWCFYDRLRRLSRLRHMLQALLLVGISGAGVLSACMLHQAFLAQPPTQGEVNVIVLGAQVKGDRPGRILRNRLDRAAEYLHSNPGAVCIVSGGQGSDEDYPEAQVMAAYLAELGIGPERIRQESSSTNTRENLRESRQLLDNPDAPTAIVTDAFHQLRAAIYARSEGLTPCGLSSYTPWGLLPCYWAREFFALPAAWFGLAF